MVLPNFTIHPNTQNTLQTITVHQYKHGKKNEYELSHDYDIIIWIWMWIRYLIKLFMSKWEYVLIKRSFRMLVNCISNASNQWGFLKVDWWNSIHISCVAAMMVLLMVWPLVVHFAYKINGLSTNGWWIHLRLFKSAIISATGIILENSWRYVHQFLSIDVTQKNYSYWWPKLS